MKDSDVQKIILSIQKEMELCWYCELQFNTDRHICKCKTDKACSKEILKKYREKYKV